MEEAGPKTLRRRVVRVLVAVVMLLGGLVGGTLLLFVVGLLFLVTPWGNAFLAERMVDLVEAGALAEGSLQVDGLQTNLFSHLELHGLRLEDAEGTPLVQVGRLSVDYEWIPLLRSRVVVDELLVEAVRLDITADADGTMDIMRVFGIDGPAEETPESRPWEGLPVDLDVGRFSLDGLTMVYGTEDVEVARIVGASVELAVSGRGTRVDLSDLAADAYVATPGPLPLALVGDLSYTPAGLALDGLRLELPGSTVTLDGQVGLEGFALAMGLERLDLERLDPVAGGAGLDGVLGGELVLEGPWSAVQLHGTISGQEGSRGAVEMDVTADLLADDLAWAGRAGLRDLHVADLYPGVGEDDPVVLDGTVTLSGSGTSFPDGLVVDATYSGAEQAIYGQRLGGVEISVRLADGRLLIRPTTVRGILGELQAEGDIELVEGPLAVRIRGTILPERLAELGAPGVRGTGTLDLRVSGNLADPSAPLHLMGSIRYPWVGYGGDVAVSDGVLDIDVHVAGSEVQGVLSLSTGAIEAAGIHVAGTSTDEILLQVWPDGRVAVSGNTMFGAVDYPETMALSGLGVGWSAGVSPSGATAAEADLHLGSLDFMGFQSPSGEVGLALEGDRVSFDVTLDGLVASLLEARGTFDPRRQVVELPHFVFGPTPRGSWLGKDIRFRLTDGGIADAEIRLAGNLGTVSLTGTVGTSGPLGADVLLDGVQLDVLSEWFPDQVDGLSGTLGLEAHVGGRGDAVTFDATVDLKRLWYADQVRWLDLAGTVSGRDGGLDTALSVSVSDLPLVNIEGRLPVNLDTRAPGLRPGGEADLMVAVRPGKMLRFSAVSPVVGELPSGSLSAAVHVRGPLVDPSLRVGAVAGLDVAGWDETLRVELDTWREGETLSGWVDLRRGFEGLAHVTMDARTRLGEVTRWAVEGGTEPNLEDYSLFADDLRIRGDLESVPVGVLADAVGGSSMRLEGRVAGELAVDGSPFAPVLRTDIRWTEGRLGPVEIEAGRFAILPTEEGYHVDSAFIFGDVEGVEPVAVGDDAATGGRFSIVGDVPMRMDIREPLEAWENGPVDLVVSGDGIPLAVATALDQGVRAAEGMLVLEGHIGGTLTDPVPELRVSIADGGLAYRPVGLNLSDMQLELLADRRRVRLVRFQVHTEPIRGLTEVEPDRSIIRASGVADFEDGALSHLSAQVDFDDGAFLVATSNQRARIEGDLMLSGAWPALAVDGDLSLVQGKVFLDAASFLSAAPLELDPMLKVRRGVRTQGRTVSSVPSVIEDFVVNVNLDLGRNLDFDLSMPFLDSYGSFSALVAKLDMSARLGGQLDVGLEQGEPVIVGEVDIVSGTVGVLRSRFDLQESKIAFTGKDYTEPVLDILARMSVTGATVDMAIAGTPSSPDIEFSSEEYPDQTEILTILLTGEAPDNLDAEGGQGTAAALAGLLLNSLFGGLGSFSIEPDGSVRAGLPVSQSIYATTAVNPGAATDENQLTIELEWSILPKLVASGGAGVPNSWADLFWEFRF